PLMTSRSVAASNPVMFTVAARPKIVTPLASPTIWITSLPAVPSMVIVSGALSPTPEPGAPSRSILTTVTSVPLRSWTLMVSAPPRALTSMCSRPLRSMVTLPKSRDRLARLPLAEMSIFSRLASPLNWSVSVPAWPSTVSLPSPGFQTNVSLPALPVMVSLPATPLIVRLIWPGLSAEASMVSLPAPPLTTSVSLAASAPGARPLCGQSVTAHRCAGVGGGVAVVAGGAVDDPLVRLAVALAASRRRREVDGDLLDVGSGEIVHRDAVGAAQGIELDALDAVEVHGDAADVAGQPRALAVGRDVHALIDVGAVEHERIGAGLALHDVPPVARIPL